MCIWTCVRGQFRDGDQRASGLERRVWVWIDWVFMEEFGNHLFSQKRKDIRDKIGSIQPGRDWFSCAKSVRKIYRRHRAISPMPSTPLLIAGTFKFNGLKLVGNQNLQRRNSKSDVIIYFVQQLFDFQSFFVPYWSFVCNTHKTFIF